MKNKLKHIAKSVLPESLLKNFRKEFTFSCDLSYLKFFDEFDKLHLDDTNYLVNFLQKLGINNSNLSEIPTELHKYCGFGLQFWQSPIQFAKYLQYISKKNISSYLEIGTNTGGTYLITTEILKRFNTGLKSYGIDIFDNISLKKHSNINPDSYFFKMDSTSTEFDTLIKNKCFDLVLIDGNHTYEYCLSDFNKIKNNANIIAFHDIVSDACPDVIKIWQEIKMEYSKNFTFKEFTSQYKEISSQGKSFFGIGLMERINLL